MLKALAKSSLNSTMKKRNGLDGCQDIEKFQKVFFGEYPFKGHFFRGSPPR